MVSRLEHPGYISRHRRTHERYAGFNTSAWTNSQAPFYYDTDVPATYYGMPEDIPLEMMVTVIFEDVNGKTRMTLRHAGLPAGMMIDSANEGWSSSFDKLAGVVAELKEGR